MLKLMNQYFEEGKVYDIESYYARQQFSSVHIGDFKLFNKLHKEIQKPKVVVLMPVYNNHEFLEDAIKSILGQSYQNLILVIVNDGSTDERVG